MRRRLVYFTKEALISLRRNLVLSFAAIIVVFLTLLAVGVVVLTAFFVGALIKGQEQKVEIKVFLSDTASPESIQVFQNKVLSWPEVKKVRYVSKEEALKRLKKMFKEAPEILEELPGNPLPASLEIRLKDSHFVFKVVKRIKKEPNIKEVIKDLKKDIKYGQSFVAKFFAVTRVIRVAGIIFISLLSFVSLALIVNTIRVAIFARRKEIAIMKLVGASNWFIRFPFMLEGIFQGLIGAFLTIGLLYLVLRPLFRWLARQGLDWLGVPFSYSTFLHQFNLLLLLLTLGGLLIGATGSVIAMRRFLKV